MCQKIEATNFLENFLYLATVGSLGWSTSARIQQPLSHLVVIVRCPSVYWSKRIVPFRSGFCFLCRGCAAGSLGLGTFLRVQSRWCAPCLLFYLSFEIELALFVCCHTLANSASHLQCKRCRDSFSRTRYQNKMQMGRRKPNKVCPSSDSSTQSDKKVVRLDITVQKVLRVHVLYPIDHLVRKHYLQCSSVFIYLLRFIEKGLPSTTPHGVHLSSLRSCAVTVYMSTTAYGCIQNNSRRVYRSILIHTERQIGMRWRHEKQMPVTRDRGEVVHLEKNQLLSYHCFQRELPPTEGKQIFQAGP